MSPMTETTHPMLRESSDPLERALVRAAWHEIHVLEDVREGPARRMYKRRWDAFRDRAHEAFTPRPAGNLLPAGLRSIYESPANVTRFRRTIDYLRPGDRLLEIGIGRGYLATMIISEGDLDRYLGLDLVGLNVRATQQMLEVNGLADRAEVREGDLYDLTRADAESIDATIVICCEVLEHLPDPEAGLRTLADALPDGADLLFSTPLLGRLEGVWGHTAMFGVERIRAMMAEAGLVAHHVEALDNTWITVLASRSEEPSERVRSLVAHDVDVMDGVILPPDRPRAVLNVPPAGLERRESTWVKRMDLTIEDVPGKDGSPAGPVHLTATPRKGLVGPQYVGVVLGVPGDLVPRGVRFELDVPDPTQLDKVVVELRHGDEVLGRWSWVPAETPTSRTRSTFMLQDGRKGRAFLRSPTYKGDLTTTDTVEIYAKVAKGCDVDVTLNRWGWVV